MNAIKHATQPMIQNTILTSQNDLSTTILSTWIPKTHIDTGVEDLSVDRYKC